jgi:alpha-beta hydrolase superfamily lysophospholipase
MTESYHYFLPRLKTYTYRISPSNPKAVVVLIHGLGEHAGRYREQIHYFADRSLAVFTGDLPGHGRSEGIRGDWNHIDELYILIQGFIRLAKEEYPALPIILYGHSMGGNLAAGFTLSNHPAIQGAIFTGSAIYTPKDIPISLAKLITRGPNWLRKIRIKNGLDLNSLCGDQTVTEAYRTDPLVHNQISLGAGASILLNAHSILQSKPTNALPVLVMHGALDRICFPKGSEELAKLFGSASTIKIWANMYHEIHHEVNKNLVWDFTIEWIQKNVLLAAKN